jgi:hypothetical protein
VHVTSPESSPQPPYFPPPPPSGYGTAPAAGAAVQRTNRRNWIILGAVSLVALIALRSEAKPGTYETTSSDLEGCYWERGRNGQIVANNFITASKVKIRVTIRAGDDTFVTRGCGNWIRVG